MPIYVLVLTHIIWVEFVPRSNFIGLETEPVSTLESASRVLRSVTSGRELDRTRSAAVHRLNLIGRDLHGVSLLEPRFEVNPEASRQSDPLGYPFRSLGKHRSVPDTPAQTYGSW